jgi:L-cystine uptake protein TcyP (sodium:dicarboxylate symporter family)
MGEEKAFDWWARMRKGGVKVAKGWSEAYYTDFSRAEGGARPMVISYATSPAAELFYSKEKLTQPPTGSLSLPGAVFKQVEGVALVKGGQARPAAEKFIEFMRSAEVQKQMQTEMWMYPVEPGVALADVMKFAPVAVFAAMASTVAINGLGILAKFAVFMVDFYIGLFVLWCVLVLAGFIFLGPRIKQLLINIKEAFLISFATASSEAAYPKILAGLDRFGVERKISSFVMPLGYSFNLDGSMMYCTFATLFIAQAYDIHLSIGTQITMLLILMMTSKGMAGVPRASLVVIAATLNQFSIPEAGLLMILGVDTFLDMGRSATNAVGNSIASAVVAKWEGALLSEADAHTNALRMDQEQAEKMHELNV